MGLDQYLYTNSKAVAKAVNEAMYQYDGEGFDEGSWHATRGIAIYWRKANAIHKWFVDHVQDGRDDCGIYYVTLKQLIELRDTCRRIMDECPLVDGTVYDGLSIINGEVVHNHFDGKVMTNTALAEELLPTQDGFFFGGTDYDQYYYEDLEHTVEAIDIIEGLLKPSEDSSWNHVVPDEPDWFVTFHYHSSW